MEEKMHGVSLCMIVRDEEKYLGQALESLRPVVNEIIVVDTGSKDRTIEIAKSYGAKVFHFDWVDDFSAARNFSISKASGRWLLAFDADEVLDEHDHKNFTALLNEPMICWRFTERHYTNDPLMSGYRPVSGEYPACERRYGGFFESQRVRLFANDPEIRFTGRVHELVEPKILQRGPYRIEDSRIPIHHYGHTAEAVREKVLRKTYLYTQIGEQKINAEPSQWQHYFELGIQYSNLKLYDQSLAKFEKAADLNPGFFEIYGRMGYVLCELGRYPEAIQALEHALRINPEDYETYGNLGVVFVRMEKYPRAVEALSHATRIHPEFVRGYFTLANAWLRMGKLQEAVVAYRKTLQLCPGYTIAKIELATLLILRKELNEAEELLRSALEDDCQNTAALFHLGMLYQMQHRSPEALINFERFLRLSDNQELNAQVGRACQRLRHLGIQPNEES